MINENLTLNQNESSSTKKGFPFFKVIRSRALLVIATAMIVFIASIVYGFVFTKPVCTVKQNVVVNLTLTEPIGPSTQPNSNDATISTIFVGTIKEIIRSPKVIAAANDHYNFTKGLDAGTKNISLSSVSVTTSSTTLIMNIGYSDKTVDIAEDKLTSVVYAAQEELKKTDAINAAVKEINVTQNTYDISVKDGRPLIIVIGFILGVALGVGLACALYLLDDRLDGAKKGEEETETLA